MRDEVTRALKLQSDERKRFESALAAAQQVVSPTGRLPAYSDQPAELFDMTLQTIHHNERVAHAYARVAAQAGVLARASLDVAKAVRADLPELSDQQREALQRAETEVGSLQALRASDPVHPAS
jgi:hypothetical protein